MGPNYLALSSSAVVQVKGSPLFRVPRASYLNLSLDDCHLAWGSGAVGGLRVQPPHAS